jgi:hypothetical protein
MLVRYSSAPCGAGKTHRIIETACELARSEKVLILQPSKELIHKTVAEELLHPSRARRPKYEVFTGDHTEGSVVGALVRYLNKPQDCGVVFATHQGFCLTPFIANRSDWNVVVDEAPEVVRHKHHVIRHSHRLLTDEIRTLPYNAVYSRVVPISPSKMREFAANKDGDELIAHLRDTFQILANQNFDSYVNIEQYERLRSGSGKTFDIHSVLKPSMFDGFNSVFMAGANFADTLAFKFW